MGCDLRVIALGYNILLIRPQVRDQGNNEFPGDFVPEVRVVWASGAEGKDLFLVMANSINYMEDFNTESDLSEFKEFVKKQKGVTNYRLYSDFGDKSTHLATSISLKHFDKPLRKRIMKTVSIKISILFSTPH